MQQRKMQKEQIAERTKVHSPPVLEGRHGQTTQEIANSMNWICFFVVTKTIILIQGPRHQS